MDAPGAAELSAELAGRGVHLDVVAVDVTSRAECVRLLATIPPQCPLGVVVHAAGVLDDATLLRMTDDQIERVIDSKVTSALHIDELTTSIDDLDTVYFSSAAGVLGSAGQGAYAAANAALDALAVRRRLRGLGARSLAWGAWDLSSGMTGGMTTADLGRLVRAGTRPLSAATALALFDAAMAADAVAQVLIDVDLGAIRSRASGAGLLSTLVPSRLRTVVGGRSLREQLDAADEPHRRRTLVTLVCGRVAAVLGYAADSIVDPDQAFHGLGFTSLSAIELRNELVAATGVGLPSTVAFDHPTPAALADHLYNEMFDPARMVGGGFLADLERLETSLATLTRSESAPGARSQNPGVHNRLRALLDAWRSLGGSGRDGDLELAVATADDDDLFKLLDRELEAP